jgi:hypothetical protein
LLLFPATHTGRISVRLAAVRLALVVLLVAAACGPTLPQQPIQRALVRDVARVVDVRQKVGWLVDDVEVEAVLPDALKSACHVEEVHRTAAMSWLDGEIARRGGPPEEAWRRAGKDLSKLEDLLLAVRTRLVLARADEWVRKGKCPFWIEPDPNFDGFHVLGRRWIVGAEAGGRFIVGAEKGIVGYGAGGAGRLLGGYGINDRTSLFLGLEAGGGARFTDVPLGEKTPIPDFVAIVALPVIGRYTFGLSGFVEAETGAMAYLNQVEAKVEPGFRGGLAVGGSYLRMKRGLLPRFTFAITIDHAPGWGGASTVTQVSAGLRAGFDLSR